MSEDNSVRLAKRMVELGLCSRREADEYIEQGLVRVDGEIVRVLGSRVQPEQRIELERPARPLDTAPATLLLHRVVEAGNDWQALVQAEHRSSSDHSERVFLPRHLRRQTAYGATGAACSGLVILSQDWHLQSKLAACEEEYLVAVEQAPAVEQLNAAASSAAATSCKITRQSDHQLRFVLQRPAADAIAALCTQLGCPARSIRCIRIGRLALGNLEPGGWRYLQGTDRI